MRHWRGWAAVTVVGLFGRSCAGSGGGETTPLSPSAALPDDAVESGFTGSVSAQNASPVMVLRTRPPVANGEITTQGRVTFNLCNSSDPDQNPDAPEEGDTLNWQFHFGDSGAPAFNADGSFNPTSSTSAAPSTPTRRGSTRRR